jgi:2,3-bisphosphoglycerate-independent phosphoglycerate mutase
VTFFFNGGEETTFPGEERILVPSPKVATYDLKPEMSAVEVTDRLVEAINGGTFDFILVNFANTDMVGHTGDLQAAIKAVETVDTCLGRLDAAIREAGGAMLITADHGNAEQMLDAKTGQPHTAHTTNLVPLVLAGNVQDVSGLESGKLADIAPTALDLLGLTQPAEMSGKSLIVHAGEQRATG